MQHEELYRAPDWPADNLDRFVAQETPRCCGTYPQDNVAGVYASLCCGRVLKRRHNHEVALGVVVYLHTHAPKRAADVLFKYLRISGWEEDRIRVAKACREPRYCAIY